MYILADTRPEKAGGTNGICALISRRGRTIWPCLLAPKGKFCFMIRLTRDKKEQIVADLKESFKNSPATVFVHFERLNIQDEQAMRNSLREQNVKYLVARKTLIKRALEEAGIEGQMPELEGELAVAFLNEGNDATAPARGVHEYVEKLKDSLAIIGGVFEGKFKSREEMNEIATIPSEDVLRGMFVNLINSPIQGLVITLSQIAEKKEA